MSGFGLEITLLEDCAFSERGASEGGHRGLDYVPGGALLGAVASRLYESLSRKEALLLFHSGKVRFGNGFPIALDGKRAWPVPLAWHHAKGSDPAENGQLVPGRLTETKPGEEGRDGVQPVQMRRGYVSLSGDWVRPGTAFRMKTAIDPGTGRAREAALFGYESLPAGTRLRAWVGADDDVPEEMIERLRDALSSGPLLIGKSRSAEYGRVEVSVVEESPIEHGPIAEDEVTLWLLSDLAAMDPHGQPTLFPRPEWLGLPEGDLLTGRSFIRVRRYSPWNAHRGGPDLERQVICQGSVLRFGLKGDLTDEHLRRISAGLGAHREAGLGYVWLNPPILMSAPPKFIAPSGRAGQTAGPRSKTDTPLIRWLENQAEAEESRLDLGKKARGLAEEYWKILRSARRLKGLDEKVPIGPSASQWGSVMAQAKARGNDLSDALFGAQAGVCKPTAPGWQDEFFDAQIQQTKKFADWIRNVFGTPPDRRLAQRLSREIQDLLKKESRR